MMRFLADENMPRNVVLALRGDGMDTVWIREAAPGLSDLDVLAWAIRDGRVLLRFDKDFGELARGAGLRPPCGIVLFRIPMPPAADAGERLAAIVLARQDWAGALSVIEPGRVRMRALQG